MIKYFTAALIALVSTSAQARMHTLEEQKKVIEICRTISVNGESYKKGMDIVTKSDASAEDKDYIIDMCSAYIGGKLDGLKKAKEIIDE